MIPTPEQAYALVCDYNEGEFHRKHARIVGDVMRWYANELGYGAEADFWQTVGILHDLLFGAVAGTALHQRAGADAGKRH